MKTKVLLVGSNPSIKSPDLSPFHASTRSRIIIDEWFRGIDTEMQFINLIDETRPGNAPLKTSEIKSIIPPLVLRLRELNSYKIIALGRSAETALTLAGVSFYSMPHPSGRNRLLNDKEYVARKIKGMIEFINHP